MTSLDFQTIEQSLNVNLPDHFKSFHDSFNGFGNHEFELSGFIYTQANDLIENNKKINSDAKIKSIVDKLVIGNNGGGDYYLIDLKNPQDTRVFFFDHEESVEEHFNNETDSWNWDGLVVYNDLQAYKEDLDALFGKG